MKAPEPRAPRLPCGQPGCRRRANRFGKFAGGICEEHALRAIDDGIMGLADFHPEHRAALEAAQARRKPA